MKTLVGNSEPEPQDIVKRLIAADAKQRSTEEGAMMIGHKPSSSILLEAAEEILKLRHVLGITEN